MQKIVSLFSALLVALVVASPVFAKTRDSMEGLTSAPCTDLVKECFSKVGDERLTCFYDAGQHPFCDGTDLGKLSMKRWSYGPAQHGGQDAPPALTGPQLVDQSCLSNFDNEWSGRLMSGDITGESVKSLSKTLDDCRKNIANELLRP